MKVSGAKETYSHPLFRRGQYAECQRIASSGVNIISYDKKSSPSSLLVAVVAGQPMMPLDIYNNPRSSSSNNRTTLGRSFAGSYFDTNAALMFPNSRLHGTASRTEEDSFGQFLRKHSVHN